jgi:hypothetical protein
MNATPAEPPHPISALTTYEIRDYRRRLEHCLRTLPVHATVRELIRHKLDLILAEVDSRSRLHQANGRSRSPSG